MYRHPSPDELICIWKKNCETYTFDKDHLQTNYERKAYQDTQFEDVNTDTDLPTDVASLVQTTAYTYNAYGGGQRPRLRSSAAAVRPNGHPNIDS